MKKQLLLASLFFLFFVGNSCQSQKGEIVSAKAISIDKLQQESVVAPIVEEKSASTVSPILAANHPIGR